MKAIRKEEAKQLIKEGKGNLVKPTRHKYYLMEDETLLNSKRSKSSNK